MKEFLHLLQCFLPRKLKSPWSAEVLITGNTKLPLFDESDDGLALNYGGNRLSDFNSRGYLETLSTSSCSSEEFCLEGEDDCFLLEAELAVAFDSDLSTVSSDDIWSGKSSPCLQEELLEVEWSPPPVPEGSQAFTCTTIKPKSHRSPHRQACPKWSQLSKAEKLKKVEELSSLVSRELGLRQQMEVIKIIDPTADVSYDDAEFIIDLEDLNDRKLESIENIVNLHSSPSSELDFQRSNHNSEKKFSKKNKSQDRHPCNKVNRRRIQKEHKQRLKEQRSGLFVQEERLAVSTMAVEEEIDVLG